MISKCKDLIIDKFITCLCDEDYTVLGEGTKDEQFTAWSEIRREYDSLLKDQTLKRIYVLEDEIVMWQLKYKTISEAVDLSRLWRSEKILDLFRAEGWDFGFPEDDVNKYQKDLDRVGKRAKVFLANIQEKVNELKAITDGLTTSEKPDRATMVNNVLIFSKYMGFHIDIYKASAEDYALIRNNYYEQIEALNNGGK